MASKTENKLFEARDSNGTKVLLVEMVSGWKRELRVRLNGIEKTRNLAPNHEFRESARIEIKAPEELDDFVIQLGQIINDQKAAKQSFSLGPHGRDGGYLRRSAGEPLLWGGLKENRSTGARYGFWVDEDVLRGLLGAAGQYQ